MEKILLKKSFRVKDLKIINFNSLWGYKGIFTTIRLVGNKPKLILAEEHIKKLNRDSSRLSINYKLSKEFLLNLQYTLPCKYCRINLKNNLIK